MQTWRNEFLTGNIKICEKPMKTFKCHKMYDHLIKEVELSKIQNKAPIRLDLRLNGKCNLECIMCDVWRQPNHLYDQSDLWTWGPSEVFPHLREVDMLGGEPFIQKDTFRFIEEVLKVNSNVTWGFITNGQYKLTDKILDVLKKIKLRHIHVSLDSLDPKTYSEIRKGGNLQKTLDVLQTLKKFKEETGQHFAIFVSVCVQKLNFTELPAFKEFCEQNGFQPILQDLIGLDHLSVRSLYGEDRRQAIELFKTFKNVPGFEILDSVLGNYEHIADMVI
jgi:cyclic pyranopterin phosphate synthase